MSLDTAKQLVKGDRHQQVLEQHLAEGGNIPNPDKEAKTGKKGGTAAKRHGTLTPILPL